MIQPGKKLTSPDMEEFLSNQNLSAQFAFLIESPNEPSYEKIFSNESDSFVFIQENPNVLYEFKYSLDVV